MNTTNTTYTLRQAADLTGYSLGKFRYNRTKLQDAGATITPEGWKIPHSTLQQLGWLGNKTPINPNPTLTPLQIAEGRIAELEIEIEQLKSRRSLFGGRRK